MRGGFYARTWSGWASRARLPKAGGVYAELYNTQFAKALENEREMAENVWDGVVIDDSDY